MLETRVRAQQHVSNGNGTNILIATASVTCVWSLVMRTAVCAICMAQILIHIDFIIQSSTRPQTSFLHWLKTILNGNIAPVCFSSLFCRLRMVRLRSIEWPDTPYERFGSFFFFCFSSACVFQMPYDRFSRQTHDSQHSHMNIVFFSLSNGSPECETIAE